MASSIITKGAVLFLGRKVVLYFEKIDLSKTTIGCLAQLVEHRLYMARVGGSNPSAPTKLER